ncbi:MAG: hypothetical protein QOH58_394 [Thermoleophilaceae bacterium]|nr:hypothetical protein [Thermoleophilaceae bacterium]
MAPRSRILAFGSAGVLVVAGAACGVLVDGLTGQVLLIALTVAGMGGTLLLLFLEVGLSEDQERERAERQRRESAGRPVEAPRWPWLPRGPRRPD